MKVSQVLRSGILGFRVRHLVIVIIILFILASGLFYYVAQSDAYEVAEHFARTRPEVLNRVGAVSEVRWRFLDGFHLTYSGSGGDASIVLAVRGDKEEVILDIRMRRVANLWDVEAAYVSTKNEKAILIQMAR